MAAELKIYEKAVGACTVCGEDSGGSMYWTPLPDDVWAVLRPHVAHLFSDADHIQNILFIPPYSTPFCSAICSNKALGY